MRIQCGNPNYLLPRQQHDPNSPYTAFIVNTDWFGVQSLLSPEVTRLASYAPGLDAHIATAQRNAGDAAPAAEGAAASAPEPEQEPKPADLVADPDQEPEEQEVVPHADERYLDWL